MKQKDAVYGAVTEVLGTTEFEGSVVLTKEQREQVQAIVFEGFKAGEIEFADTAENQEKMSSDSKLMNYVSGLTSNWLRKDSRLNGGTKYVPSNPGSRTGQGDDTLKTLRALHKQFSVTDSSKLAAIESEIAKRVSEIQAERASKNIKKVNIDALPADLRAKLGI